MLPSRLNVKENGKIYVKKKEVVELKQMLFSILGKKITSIGSKTLFDSWTPLLQSDTAEYTE